MGSRTFRPGGVHRTKGFSTGHGSGTGRDVYVRTYAYVFTCTRVCMRVYLRVYLSWTYFLSVGFKVGGETDIHRGSGPYAVPGVPRNKKRRHSTTKISWGSLRVEGQVSSMSGYLPVVSVDNRERRFLRIRWKPVLDGTTIGSGRSSFFIHIPTNHRRTKREKRRL